MNNILKRGFCILGLPLILTIPTLNSTVAANLIEPGGDDKSARMAAFNPDEFAWQLFFYLNQQAQTGKAGVPDATKKSFADYDPDKDVVWESWALASADDINGESKSEVFKNPAIKPDDWESLRSQSNPKILSRSIKSSPLINIPGINSQTFNQAAASDTSHLFAPFPEVADKDEVRMNRAVFDTIRDKELYSVEGILRRYAQITSTNALDKGSLLIAFPQGAKEVKARWIKLDSDAQKARYHWRILKMRQPDGSIKDEIWGLAALHIITRDLPNWVWADFSHIDMEDRKAWCKTSQDPAGETCPRDVTTRGSAATAGHDGVRAETRGSKWENYVLRGTQIAFTDSIGNATILSNPVIEHGFQKSSCISCHARSAIQPNVEGGIQDPGSDTTALGVPSPSMFLKNGKFLQIDFLWSIPFRVKSEKPNQPHASLFMR